VSWAASGWLKLAALLMQQRKRRATFHAERLPSIEHHVRALSIDVGFRTKTPKDLPLVATDIAILAVAVLLSLQHQDVSQPDCFRIRHRSLLWFFALQQTAPYLRGTTVA
jgi:hypothetical protein